jgi:hypothetical protein
MSYDSKYLGPGYWASWHIKSVFSDTEEKKGEVARNIALDIKNFPCAKCKDHAKTYVIKNPLMVAVKDKDPLSMFKWTVDFHNEVNLRLKKKIFSYQDALVHWNGSNFCTEDCDEQTKPKKKIVRKKIIKKKKVIVENKGDMVIKNY